MKWNWQQVDWPNFSYNSKALEALEAKFLHQSGLLLGAFRHINNFDRNQLTIELICNEAIKTSEIEGEVLNRDSVQSSLRRQFGLETEFHKIPAAEKGIAEMMVDLYRSFEQPLSENMLSIWHTQLMQGRDDLSDIGRYRTHPEPMQIISGNLTNPTVHFEAPPSIKVKNEMQAFIHWFNQSSPGKENSLPIMTRAGIAHLYFVCIHPFEDGNGRIARAVSEKALSQALKQPTLIALSTVIQQNKKEYYDMLSKSNKENEITAWLIYFSETILAAQEYTQKYINFLIEKTKLYDRLRNKLNVRQKKVIDRMFQAGLKGFEGGLSSKNYCSITGASSATATRDLQELVSNGALIKTGELKGTRYYLKIEFS